MAESMPAMDMNMTMYMMPMYFSFTETNTYLFKDFTSSSFLTYMLWLIGIAILSCGVLALDYARTQYQNKVLRELAIQQKTQRGKI